MVAKFISTQGEFLEAVIELNGTVLHVMDEFSYKGLSPGGTVKIEVVPGLYYEDEEWESMFSGNPEAKKEFEHQSGGPFGHGGELTGDFGHFGGQVVYALLHALAHFVADKAADVHAFPKAGYQAAHGDVAVLYEHLIHQAVFLLPLGDFTGHDLGNDLLGLALFCNLR